MSVKRAQADIDSSEFAEWVAFNGLEPFGESRGDLRSAIVACTIANAHRGKRRRAFKVDDFMPKFKSKTTQRDPVQIFRMFSAFAEMHNASLKGRS
jgi:hypothetical protein